MTYSQKNQAIFMNYMNNMKYRIYHFNSYEKNSIWIRADKYVSAFYRINVKLSYRKQYNVYMSPLTMGLKVRDMFLQKKSGDLPITRIFNKS